MRARRRVRVKEWIVKLWADERVRTVVVSRVEVMLMYVFLTLFFDGNRIERDAVLLVCLIGAGLLYTAWAMLCAKRRLYTQAATLYLNVECGMFFCVLTPWIYTVNFVDEVLSEVIYKLLPFCLLIPRLIGYIGYRRALKKAGTDEQARNGLGKLIVVAGAVFAPVMVIVVSVMGGPSAWEETWTAPMVLQRVGALMLIYVLRAVFELALCKGKALRRLEWQALALQDLAQLSFIASWLLLGWSGLDLAEMLLLWVWLLGTAAVRTVVGWKTGFWRKEA